MKYVAIGSLFNPPPPLGTYGCTFGQTSRNPRSQDWYRCYTCNLRGNMGCCVVCAETCHAGHDLQSCGNVNGFCDCGAGTGVESTCPPCISLKEPPQKPPTTAVVKLSYFLWLVLVIFIDLKYIHSNSWLDMWYPANATLTNSSSGRNDSTPGKGRKRRAEDLPNLKKTPTEGKTTQGFFSTYLDLTLLGCITVGVLFMYYFDIQPPKLFTKLREAYASFKNWLAYQGKDEKSVPSSSFGGFWAGPASTVRMDSHPSPNKAKNKADPTYKSSRQEKREALKDAKRTAKKAQKSPSLSSIPRRAATKRK
eukprot:TRINITY_DN4291_c0_g2_i3.p1 TRINITY_DN4291_c0_g2~~TRINITY_DN4291_c0_g2_i3.p1  ORF type:complete len:308 (-),score=57.72 TRINITY_DN4291_c0_g2_i3:263-1186(-)